MKKVAAELQISDLKFQSGHRQGYIPRNGFRPGWQAAIEQFGTYFLLPAPSAGLDLSSVIVKSGNTLKCPSSS